MAISLCRPPPWGGKNMAQMFATLGPFCATGHGIRLAGATTRSHVSSWCVWGSVLRDPFIEHFIVPVVCFDHNYGALDGYAPPGGHQNSLSH
jgi:hypothetical protein